MWAVKILTGPQAGQVFPLKEGKHTLGRGSSCEIKIASNSVSKEHATILVTNDKIIVSDLDSRNGTFVNGIKIQNQRLNNGDKMALHDILIAVMQVADNVAAFPGGRQPASNVPAVPSWAGNAAARLQDPFAAQSHMPGQMPGMMDPQQGLYPEMQMQAQNGMPLPQAPPSAPPPQDLAGHVNAYIDNVVMPGVYGLAKSLPYRWSLGLLVVFYAFVVTALSIVPIVQTTKTNIEAESIRRAKTIARNMRDMNRRFIVEKNETAIDVRGAELEEGVTAALIINGKDGTVMAPAAKRGEFVNKEFVNKARREERELAEFIDDSNVGVSIPISSYNSDTGNQSVSAYAIVLYDVGKLAMTTEQTLSLFIQTLAIALLAGAILFFFLFKIVENPLELANSQLDDALREGRDDLKTDYQFPQLETFLSNINSALSRIGGPVGDAAGGMPMVINRDIEAANVVRMLPVAALTVSAIDERVISTNTAFDRLVGGGLNLMGRPLHDIPDIALQQNLIDLLPRMRSSIAEIALGEIPFSGLKYEICGQAVMGTTEPAYFLITLNQLGGEG